MLNLVAVFSHTRLDLPLAYRPRGGSLIPLLRQVDPLD